MLWAMFCWIFAIYVDVTLTHTTYLNILANQEWFKEHNNESAFSDFSTAQSNQCGMCWKNMLNPISNLQDLKDMLLTARCQIKQHTSRSLVESMP